MASIVREAVIEAPAARCWDAVRDFGALPERLARGFVTGLTMTGARVGALMDAGLTAIKATLEAG